MNVRLGIGIAILFVCVALPTRAAEDHRSLTRPIVSEDVVFEEIDGLVAVEAEHFFKQTEMDTRAWYLTTKDDVPELKPDADPTHVAGASGGAYLECLPDTRRTAKNKLIAGENFTNAPGKMAILQYKVHFNTPGKYYVWARTHSTGAEDNSLHVGLDGEWPESGQRMQWTAKRKWLWNCKQRTQKVHTGVPLEIYLNIENPGLHTVAFSMREDGFEFDKFLMTTDREFKQPDGVGPEPRLKEGKLPEAFAYVEAAPAEPEPQATVAPPADENALIMRAVDFPVAIGYYKDRDKWLAVNPNRYKQGRASMAFPFEDGMYNIVLHAVGEEDGKSTYEVRVAGKPVGELECPLSDQMYEEGPAFTKALGEVKISKGDEIEVRSNIGSEDGEEYSRARWAGLTFVPPGEKIPMMLAAAPVAPEPESVEPAKSAAPKEPLVLPRKPDGDGSVEITGDLKQWHKVTLTLDGPYAHELDNEPNPFTDLRMVVSFWHESGTPIRDVPGYFAADGNAAESSAESGTKWRAHLAPGKTGTWSYRIYFAKGENAALEAGTPAVAIPKYDGKTGSFTIAASDKTGRDLRGKGRLDYVGGHYLRFAGDGEYFLKAGADAPETFLGYKDFDGTYTNKTKLKTWEPHVKDWRPGDPTWKDGKGKGMIGAINYLASKGCNVFSFLPYNAGGDGQNVWPMVKHDDQLHYDCSKLDQWGIVFDHGTNMGMYLHFKLQEQENDDNRKGNSTDPVPAALNGGDLGPERMLYCRELIARFGHELALNWNLGEENTQSAEQQRAMAKYILDTDPYDHHIVVHTFPDWQDRVYEKLLGDQSVLTGASLQNHWDKAHERCLKWVVESAKAGRPWVVANDEQGSAGLGVPPDPGYEGFEGKDAKGKAIHSLHDIRKATLWGTLMAGGAGVEYYFGYQLPQNDLECEDFRSRDKSWDYCRIALEFFKDNEIPFWEMKNADALVGNEKNNNSKYCFARAGELYLVYLPNGGSTEIELAGASGAFSVRWFDPRNGGELQKGSVDQVEGGGSVSLGNPPKDADEDWLVVVKK